MQSSTLSVLITGNARKVLVLLINLGRRPFSFSGRLFGRLVDQKRAMRDMVSAALSFCLVI